MPGTAWKAGHGLRARALSSIERRSLLDFQAAARELRVRRRGLFARGWWTPWRKRTSFIVSRGNGPARAAPVRRDARVGCPASFMAAAWNPPLFVSKKTKLWRLISQAEWARISRRSTCPTKTVSSRSSPAAFRWIRLKAFPSTWISYGWTKKRESISRCPFVS